MQHRMLHIVVVAMTALAGAAHAQTYDPANGIPADSSLARGVLKDLPIISDARAALAQKGVYFQSIYNTDALANLSGGMKRGAGYSGRLELTTDIALDKLLGAGSLLANGKIHANAFSIQGPGVTNRLVGSYATISNIEALPTFRLFEAWYEHTLGPWSLRVGQIGVDSEHATSATAGQFNDGTFGWPALAAANLPSGGAAYPLATPGARLKYASKAFEWQIAALNGDPAPAGVDPSPQRRDPHGLDFRLRGGVYLVSELKIFMPWSDDAALKIGVWRHTGQFNDMRWDVARAPIAWTGAPALRHSGDYGVYGAFDTPVPGVQDTSFFMRAFVAPGDRNPVSHQLDLGAVRKGVFFRDRDSFGVAVSLLRLSSGLRAYDADAVFFGAGRFVRSFEAALEANYTWQVTDGWSLQPNLQYVVNPGGRAADPYDPARVIRNATAFSLRSQLKF
ncbi:MAG: carbohydrate porin [Hyphomicrobiales bacterium]|nr:carbohydrate porin [Hyphomicrobiales bacterium]